MSKRIVGLTVEIRQAYIRAFGSVSIDAECIVDPNDCCGGGGLTGTGIGAGCCGDSDPNETVGFVLSGPIGNGCANGSMTGNFIIEPGGGFSWIGDGSFDTGNIFLHAKLYCDGAGFRLGGSIDPPTDPEFFFDIGLTVDPITGAITGIITRPGCPDPIFIAFAPPCSGATSWNCEGSVCFAVAGQGGTYPTQAACLAACGVSYNCTEGSCVEVPGNTGTYGTLIQCQVACVTTYNCTSGGCVSVPGTGGTYATLEECLAACAISECGCDLPINITATVTSGVCGGSGTLTWNGSRWVGSVTLSGGTGGTLNIQLYCEGGVWKADTTGCNTVTGGTTTGACTPAWQSGLFIAACCGGAGNFNIFFTY